MLDQGEPDFMIAGPSRPKSPRIENSALESLRASLREKITSEIKELPMESQRELVRMLKPKTKARENEENEQALQSESRNFYTPTTSVKINSTQISDPDISRNNCLYEFSRYM